MICYERASSLVLAGGDRRRSPGSEPGDSQGRDPLTYYSLMLVISRACNSRCCFPSDLNPPLRAHQYILLQGGRLPQLPSSISRKTHYKEILSYCRLNKPKI